VLTVPAAPVPVPAPVGTEVQTDEGFDEDRRSTWPIVLLVLGLVAAIVLIAVLIAHGRGGDQAPTTTTESSDTTHTSSAPTTADTPSEQTTSAPAEVHIDEADYVGRPVGDVVSDLHDLGLRVDIHPVANPGGKDTDTVASVSPTSGLVEGDTVTVDFYREAEPSSAPPTTSSSSPSASNSPSPSGTGTGTGNGSPSPPSPTASQGGTTPSATPSASAATAGATASHQPSPSAPLSGREAAR
jgi:serine/threonine-protein kinase